MKTAIAFLSVFLINAVTTNPASADQSIKTAAGTTISTGTAVPKGTASLSQFTFRITDPKTGQVKTMVVRGTAEQVGKTRDVLRQTCGAFSEREQAKAILEQSQKPSVNQISGATQQPEPEMIEANQKTLDSKDDTLKQWSSIYPQYFAKSFDVNDCPPNWR